MAHRALVAYRRPPDAYALHYAHWGRGLADAIGPDAPFGGVREVAESDSAVAERLGVDPSGGYAGPPTRVDSRPLVRRATPEAVLAAVDRSAETLVVVDHDWQTQTYLVCPVGFGPADDPADPDFVFARPDGVRPSHARPGSGDDQRESAGVLGSEASEGLGDDRRESASDPTALREWVVETRSALDAAVARDTLSPDAARAAFRRALAARATVYPSDDASFLRAD
ncbi:DUF6735 family protein [Halomicrobium salinisoli]|uniref:DUF6735 family protein n=1 Tax=Halomicrobium salinisoli TaxID=2878391 RepID=UPI001CF01300|nr:DUF6735 family protein [Halomicrobium salinisoli]